MYKDLERKKIYTKNYYIANKKRLNEYQKEYNKWKEEKLKIYKKLYRKKNREILLEKEKKYRKNNREYLNIKYREYRKNNKKKIALANRKYNKTEGAKINHKIYKWYRSALKKSSSDWSITSEGLVKILEKQNYLCNMCWVFLDKSIKKFVQLDHIIPLSKWGTHSIKNVQFLCIFCNAKKSNKILLPME